jgi:hypothetical protein
MDNIPKIKENGVWKEYTIKVINKIEEKIKKAIEIYYFIL